MSATSPHGDRAETWTEQKGQVSILWPGTAPGVFSPVMRHWMSSEAVAQVAFGCSEATERRRMSAASAAPQGAQRSLRCLERPHLPFSRSLCQLKSKFQALPQAFLPAQSICPLLGCGGVFSSKRSPQLPAAAAGCRSGLLLKLFPIHQSKVFPYCLPAGCPPPATSCKLKAGWFPRLTAPQLTVKGSGCPGPTRASAATARAGGAGGLRRGWELRRLLCQHLHKTRCGADRQLPPRSASQASWECARLSLRAAGCRARVSLTSDPALSRDAQVCPEVPGFPSGRCSHPGGGRLGADPRGESAGQFLEPSEDSAMPCPADPTQPCSALPWGALPASSALPWHGGL